MLEAGAKAPDFTLPDKLGTPVHLSDFLEKKDSLIDKQGVIEKVMSDTNAEEILAYLNSNA